MNKTMIIHLMSYTLKEKFVVSNNCLYFKKDEKQYCITKHHVHNTVIHSNKIIIPLKNNYLGAHVLGYWDM